MTIKMDKVTVTEGVPDNLFYENFPIEDTTASTLLFDINLRDPNTPQQADVEITIDHSEQLIKRQLLPLAPAKRK